MNKILFEKAPKTFFEFLEFMAEDNLHNVPKSEYKSRKEELIEACHEEPKREKVFFYVFVPWNGEPKVRHSFQSAKLEAFRISQKTGKETFILQAIKSYKVKEVVETNFMHQPEVFGKHYKWN